MRSCDQHIRPPLRRLVASSLRRSAFSLVEVMIVVVIVGLLAGVVTYATTGYMDRAKRERARSDIATYSGAVDSFYLDKGRHPSNQEGLAVLVPDFIKAVQKDPWNRPYQYVQPGKAAPYEIVTYGADGRPGGTGADTDLSSAEIDKQAKPK